MKYRIALYIGLFFLVSCVNVSRKKPFPRTYNGVKIATVFKGDCSIRALYVNHDHIFFAGSNGKFGYLNTADNSIEHISTIEYNGKNPDFRGLAHTPKTDFIVSAGNPALIYKVNFFGKRKLLYKQTTEGTFYDCIAFWNDKEGIAIGDPINGCMSFLITRDGGETWNQVARSKLPKAEKGEAAFAASNSNIAIVGNKTWVLSGGKTTRVYFSPDKGKTWKVYNTPLINGKQTTGGYSIAFYNDKLGVIFGGDYTQKEGNRANKAITTNGGKTWKLIADGKAPGYKSCVKFVPNSGGKEMVAIGPTNGISYSSNRGKTWKNLSTIQGLYTLVFLNDFTAYAAGNGKIVKLTFLENPNLQK